MNSSPITSTNSSAELKFSTRRFQLAIFIYTLGKLPFLGCEPVGGGEVEFVLDDPDGIADELELAFESGEKVSAVALFGAQKYLRRKIAVALGERGADGRRKFQNRFGETTHEYSR